MKQKIVLPSLLYQHLFHLNSATHFFKEVWIKLIVFVRIMNTIFLYSC